LSKNGQKIVKKFSKNCQIIVEKFSKNCQKLSKMVKKLPVKYLGNQCEIEIINWRQKTSKLIKKLESKNR